MDVDDIDPVQQVGSEIVGCKQVGNLPVGGRNQPEVRRFLFVSAKFEVLSVSL